MEPIRHQIFGPLRKQYLSTKVGFVFKNGTWNLGGLFFTLPTDFLNKIADAFIPVRTTKEDNIIWKLDRNRTFTTKSAYNLLDSLAPKRTKRQNARNPTTDFSWIWKIEVTDKIKMFIWMLTHELLTTSHHLYKIGISVDPTC